MEYTIEAKIIDSRHIKLNTPVTIPPGSTVLVTIESKERIADVDGWYQISEQGLELAYSVDEPEYTLDQIIFPNEEYRSETG